MKIAEFYTFSAAWAAVYYEKKNNTGGILMKKWFRKNSMNLFYLPALIIMLTFLVFPLANGFRLSFEVERLLPEDKLRRHPKLSEHADRQ